jgi:hypothetical protein
VALWSWISYNGTVSLTSAVSELSHGVPCVGPVTAALGSCVYPVDERQVRSQACPLGFRLGSESRPRTLVVPPAPPWAPRLECCLGK